MLIADTHRMKLCYSKRPRIALGIRIPTKDQTRKSRIFSNFVFANVQ